jgi:hypothetical protein
VFRRAQSGVSLGDVEGLGIEGAANPYLEMTVFRLAWDVQRFEELFVAERATHILRRAGVLPTDALCRSGRE